MPLNTEVLRDAGPYVAEDAVAAMERSLAGAAKLLLESPGMEVRHRRQLIDIVLWKFTEASGMRPHPKYNLRYVTDGARNLDVPARVNHEHVWPRKWILDRLLEGKTWQVEDLETFLRRYAVACVVTVEEHARLGGATGTGWERYARAGIPVWDRQLGAYVDLTTDQPTESRRVARVPQIAAAPEFDLVELIEKKAGDRAPHLLRLLRMARFANAAGAVAVRRDGEPSAYFRIHDTLLEEATRAVAYPHWSGRVDFALTSDDVPSILLAEPSVRQISDTTYAVSCKVSDNESAEVAEELLFLALEKLRAWSEG